MYVGGWGDYLRERFDTPLENHEGHEEHEGLLI
jgi:hypothetical protein